MKTLKSAHIDVKKHLISTVDAMIKTKMQKKRDKRNQKVLSDLQQLLQPGSARTAVVNTIAKKYKVSSSTIQRIFSQGKSGRRIH